MTCSIVTRFPREWIPSYRFGPVAAPLWPVTRRPRQSARIVKQSAQLAALTIRFNPFVNGGFIADAIALPQPKPVPQIQIPIGLAYTDPGRSTPAVSYLGAYPPPAR